MIIGSTTPAADAGGKSNLLAADLDHVLAHTRESWEDLRGGRVFLTGGTGFFGCWLLEGFVRANDRLSLGATVVVLTRTPDSFRRKAPHLATHTAVELRAGDVRSFEFPAGEFSHIVHAATDTTTKLTAANALAMADTIVEGTRRVLEFARTAGTPKLLLTSSGAIYGRQPPDMIHIPEEYAGAPATTNLASVYGESKRMAELLCAMYHEAYGIDAKIARCFAFVGPYLPLDAHFAIGNFMRDGMHGGTIKIGGDGTPYRSYLYAADLAIWLWTILSHGVACRPYNVGSDAGVTIAELAAIVAGGFEPQPSIEIAGRSMPGKPAERYVPSIRRAAAELHLRPLIDLPEAVRRTVEWHTR